MASFQVLLMEMTADAAADAAGDADSPCEGELTDVEGCELNEGHSRVLSRDRGGETKVKLTTNNRGGAGGQAAVQPSGSSSNAEEIDGSGSCVLSFEMRMQDWLACSSAGRRTRARNAFECLRVCWAAAGRLLGSLPGKPLLRASALGRCIDGSHFARPRHTGCNPLEGGHLQVWAQRSEVHMLHVLEHLSPEGLFHFPDGDYTYTASVKEFHFPDGDSTYTASVKEFHFPDGDYTYTASVKEFHFPDGDSTYTASVKEFHFPDGDYTYTASVKEFHFPDGDYTYTASVKEFHPGLVRKKLQIRAS
ncbi:hypothetical protein CYMTET_45616 [Cymbomonas tetramitiformis]|uniref:Uncharacterized protein n=1 Tax=Cymbomonas tetramitiformis TaxID=36881 RepID=A0AAE0BZ94_9CHLO|nr:hypothetical protein CYMTET_45616 [Cymbomonas tetramitiformis]